MKDVAYGRSCQCNKAIREITEAPREGSVQSVESELVPEGLNLGEKGRRLSREVERKQDRESRMSKVWVKSQTVRYFARLEVQLGSLLHEEWKHCDKVCRGQM